MNYDDFIPLSFAKKLLVRFLCLLTVFCAFLCFLIPAVLVTSIFFPVEPAQIFTSFIFLSLYSACVIALCLLIFQLFNSNQIIAFVISAVILAICNSAHNYSVYLSSTSFLASIFKTFSFAWHFDAAGKAIFDSRDFIFFVSFTALFFLLTILTEQLQKGKSYNKSQRFRLFLSVFILILTFLNSQRYFFRLDFSKNKTFSLSKYSSSLLKNVSEPLFITFYRSKTLSTLYPQIRDVSDFLDSYAAKNKNISFKIQNPDGKAEVTDLLKSYGITSQQINTSSGTTQGFTEVFSAIILEYNGKFEAIPFVIGAETLEYDLDIRVSSLLTGKKHFVNVILGNGMNYKEDYSYLVPLLSSAGITCNPIFIEAPDFATRLENATGTLLVIGDSKINIEHAIAIENYILSGKGDAIFTLSPYSNDIAGDWSFRQNDRTNLVELLENWGIRFEEAVAADISCARITMVSDSDSTGAQNTSQVLNYPMWIKLFPQENSQTQLTMFWPTPLAITDNSIAAPYLVSSPQGYSYKVKRNSYTESGSLIETNPFLLNSKPAENERGTKVLGAEIKGKLTGLYTNQTSEDSRILVIPDQYFLNTLMQNYSAGESGADFSNFDFIANSILKLSGESELAKLHQKHSEAYNSLKFSDSQVFQKAVIISLLVLFIVIPAVQIFTFVSILLLQSKKRGAKYED